MKQNKCDSSQTQDNIFKNQNHASINLELFITVNRISLEIFFQNLLREKKIEYFVESR